MKTPLSASRSLVVPLTRSGRVVAARFGWRGRSLIRGEQACRLKGCLGTPLPLREGQGEGRASSLIGAAIPQCARPSPSPSPRGRGIRTRQHPRRFRTCGAVALIRGTRAFTLIELVTSLAISAILLVSIGSAIVVASKALPGAADGA